MPGASSLAGALAGFYGAPLADFVGAVDTRLKNAAQSRQIVRSGASPAGSASVGNCARTRGSE